MKIALLSLVTILSLSSFALADATAVLGKWTAQEGDGDFSIKMNVNIELQQVTFANTCIYKNQSVTASVTVPAQITDKQIITSSAANQSLPIPGSTANCSVAIKVQTFDYSFNGQSLVLQTAGQETELQRAP